MLGGKGAEDCSSESCGEGRVVVRLSCYCNAA